MSNTSRSEMSTTIANMMEALNSTNVRRKSDIRTPLNFLNPLKRRLSIDSLESPEKRQKSDSGSDTTWISSPRETRRMRLELIEARNIISNLEGRIKQLHNIRKELQVMFDGEIKSFQIQHERDQKTIVELEDQMQSIRQREQEVIEELDEIKQSSATDKINCENKIEQLEFEIAKLQSEVKMNESEDQNEFSRLQNRIEELEMLVDAAQADAAAQKELAEEFESRLLKQSSIERDLEMKDQMLTKAQLKVKDLEYILESYGEWQAQAKLQQQKLLSYPDLEKEVERLRTENKNIREEVKNKLILEEQVNDLQTKIDFFRNQEKKLAFLQVSNAHLETIVEDWRSLAREITEETISDTMIPKKIRQYVEKLQQRELTLTSEKIEIESQLKQIQHEAKSTMLKLERSSKQITDLQTIQQQHQSFVHRLQKKLALLTRERDSYRLQLDTYEKDLTVSLAPGSMNMAQQNTYKDRIDIMEKTIDGYRELINNLEAELKKRQPLLNDNTIPVHTEQVNRLQEKIDRLQNENARLTERKDELEIRLMQELTGKDNNSCQILHLKTNPLTQSVAEHETNVKKLQSEIERLQRKIRNLEEGLESSNLSESTCSSQEVKVLKEQLKSSEIKMQRLKEYFKTSSLEFRNACYMLFGYKIDRQSAAKYTLSSMYADNPEDCLEFKVNSEGSVDLLENSYSASLEDMVELHLKHQSSIPVFLSALTMDLFNKTTMAT